MARPNPEIDDGWLCDRGRFNTVPASPEWRPTRPAVQRNGAFVDVSWDEALSRAAELLNTGGGTLVSQSLSNEAFWLLERLGQRLPGALWPAAGRAWPVQGRIENLARCKNIVLVGLDAWEDLPVLALWVRKAVLAGAKLTVLGDRNGLWRNTATWHKGDPLAHLADLSPQAEGPSAILAHPSLVDAARPQLEALAAKFGANPETGLVGAPLLGANGRGASDLAPSVARGDAAQALTSKALFIMGDEPWADLNPGSFARLVLATSQPVPEDARIDVVLPMAHAYERQASITNLEGRVQHQDGGAAPPPHARTDWAIVAELAAVLGLSLPASDNIEVIRSRIADEHPAYADIVREELLIARV
jgi:NADH-quinone oxidoreductase subunit G